MWNKLYTWQVGFPYMMLCAIWYHWYNLRNLKNTHGGVLLLVKLQAEACNFTKSNNPPWAFFNFCKLYKWYQIVRIVSYIKRLIDISLNYKLVIQGPDWLRLIRLVNGDKWTQTKLGWFSLLSYIARLRSNTNEFELKEQIMKTEKLERDKRT